MYDVARLAGVSHQTVSRVINAHPNVREETRLRVQEAITALGYRRNVAARTLVTRRSNTIGVITSVSPHWGPSSTLIGVERAARDAGVLSERRSPAQHRAGGHQGGAGDFVDQGVEGIVVIAPEAAAEHVSERVRDRPSRRHGGRRGRTGRGGADHLDRPGVRRAAGDQAPARTGPHHHRAHRRARMHGSTPSSGCGAGGTNSATTASAPDRRSAGDWTAASGHRAGGQLLRRKKVPSAVFVANDLMALGFLRAMHDAGVRVPQDISIVGFDDMPGAGHLIPGLTTVRQDLDRLGQQCIAMLLAALNETACDVGPIEPSFVLRESTADAN